MENDPEVKPTTDTTEAEPFAYEKREGPPGEQVLEVDGTSAEVIASVAAIPFADAYAALGGPSEADLEAKAHRELERTKAAPATSYSQRVDAANLKESPTNPRKRWGELDELVASIRAHGIIEPLIVRPVEGDHFEIVCGARRFRAGKQAGITEFPCEVRQLSADHVFEFQLVENLQRKDLHPIEEAEGYEQMIAAGYEVPTIAARVGKSTGWVYSRRKLLDLGPEARGAFFEGRIELSVAQVLGRQPHANQGKALLGLERIGTVKEQILFLQHSFARNLKGSPFDLKDGTLPRLGGVDGVGDCASCPSNSNNAPRELFADYDKIERAGICSNTPCFEGKAGAILERTAEKARARGEAVLTLAQTKKVISYGTPTNGSAFVIASDVIADDPKRRTWEQVFGELDADERPKVTLAPNDQKLGSMFKLYDRKEAIAAAAGLGMKWAARQAPNVKQTDAAKAKRKAADEKARAIAETVEQAMPQLITHWRKAVALPELRCAAIAAEEGCGVEEMLQIRAAFSVPGEVRPWIEKVATVKDLIAFTLAALLFPRWQNGLDELEPDLKTCARTSGVDLVAITRAQLATSKAGGLKWKKIEGGEEASSGERDYSVTYNGGAFYWALEVKGKRGTGGNCKTLAEGKATCADLEAKAVRS